MKLTFLALFAFLALPAFAGTAVTYNNDALEFRMTASPQSDDIEFCDSSDSCLTFKPSKFDGKRDSYELCDSTGSCTKYKEAAGDDAKVSRYKEAHGKCEIEIQAENLSYGGFMFDLGLQIVKVTKGTKNCQLTAPSGKRELWGIYQ